MLMLCYVTACRIGNVRVSNELLELMGILDLLVTPIVVITICATVVGVLSLGLLSTVVP